MSIQDFLKSVFGLFYFFTLPGFAISFFFMEEEVSKFERLILSTLLGIVVISLVVFYLNVFGLSLTFRLVNTVVWGITVLGVAVLLLRRRTTL